MVPGFYPPLSFIFSGFLVSFLLLLGVWCLLMFFLSPSNPSHLSHHISSGLVLLFWCKMWVAGFQFVVLSQAWFIHYTHFFPHFCLLRASFRASFRHPSVRPSVLFALFFSIPDPFFLCFPTSRFSRTKTKTIKIKNQNSTRLDSVFLGILVLVLVSLPFIFVSSFLLLPSVI